MKQRRKQASARSYYRISAKFARQGNHGRANFYRNLADRLVEQDRREQERKAQRQKNQGR